MNKQLKPLIPATASSPDTATQHVPSDDDLQRQMATKREALLCEALDIAKRKTVP